MVRIIGILGGMGPEATIDLYAEILRQTPAKRDQDHLRVLIYSNPSIPDRTRAILEGAESPLPALIDSARILEAAGAGILAIPCNTAHFYYPELRAALRVPMLHMIEETLSVLHLRFDHARSVGLLASKGTFLTRIYESVFNKAGVEVVIPNDHDQVRVHAAIDDIKAGIPGARVRDVFDSIAEALLRRGSSVIILGCTEIPLAYRAAPPNYPFLNPSQILAKAAVDWALGERNSEK